MNLELHRILYEIETLVLKLEYSTDQVLKLEYSTDQEILMKNVYNMRSKILTLIHKANLINVYL